MTPVVGRSPGERLDTLAALRQASAPTFKALGEGSYRFLVPQLQASLEVDFLRRSEGQLKGEVLVRCELKGARTVDGVLTVADVNLSSSRTRASFAKDLGDLARTNASCDWRAVVEEFSLRILAAERDGAPGVWLSEVKPRGADRLLYVNGFPLLERHPLMIFGDGGTGKSMLALHFAGSLALKGRRVGLFDWELDAEEHRLRLEQLFPGVTLPRIRYVRCSHPFAREVERLRREVKTHELDYIVFDSVGYACDGPPEAAEQAMRYFQALRTLGQIGTLHLAHVRGGVEGADLRPFGSVFWHNSARATWNIKPASREADDGRLQVALHHRKFNTSGRMRSVGFELAFDRDRTTITSLELGSVPDLAAQLGLRERVRLALLKGPRNRDELRADLDDITDAAFRKILSREKKAGRVLEFPEGRWALAEKVFQGV